jgi:stage V sporulation protein B
VSVERHISHTIVMRALLTVLMMLQSIFVTRLLGPEGRGLFAKLQASQSFFLLLLGLGLSSAITYYIANRKVDPKKVLGVGLIMWTFGVLCLALFEGIFHFFPSTDLIFPAGFATRFFIGYLFLSFAFNSFQLFVNAALSGQHKFIVCNWIEIIAGVARVVVFGAYLILAYLGRRVPALETIFIWDVALVGIRMALFVFLYLREFGIRFDFRISNIFKPVIAFSFLIYVSYLINFFYLRLDYWLIEWKLGLKDLGVYSVAAGLAQFLTLVPMTLNSVMLPHLSDGDPMLAFQKFKLFSRLNATAISLGGLVLIVLASPLIRGFYGNSFAGAIAPLRFITGGAVFLSFKHLFVYYNVSQKRMRPNIEAEILGLIVGLTSNLILIPRLGTVGAGVSSLIANMISCGYVMLGISWTEKLRVRELFFVNRGDVARLWVSLFPAS